MSLVKGLKRQGFIEVNQPVKFMHAIQGGFVAMPWGRAFYVDGTNGVDTNTGLGPNESKLTIQSAVTAAIGGDIIYVRPKVYTLGTGFARYTEDVTATMGGAGGAGVTSTNARKSIIGVVENKSNLDYGGVRWKHATATNLTNDAPALHIENIGFFSEGATYGVLLRNNGATRTQEGSTGTSFYNCAFKGKGIYTLSGGDGLSIDNSRFQCSYEGVSAQLNYSCSANPGRRLTVRNCEWLDGNGTAPTSECIVIAAPCTEILIRDCFFPSASGASYCYINADGASNTGMIANCYFSEADLDTDLQILPGGMEVVAIYDVTGIATTA